MHNLSIYTAIPSSVINKEIIKLSNCFFLQKVKEFYECVELNTDISLNNEKEHLADIDLSKVLHPKIYLSLYNLQVSISSGIVSDVRTSLLELNNYIIQHINEQSKPLHYKIEDICHSAWEEEYVSYLNTYDQLDIVGNSVSVLPISNNIQLEFHKKNIESAIRMIKVYDSELFSEISSFVTHIKVFKGEVLRGDTSARVLGSMWIRIPEPEDDQVGYWIEHIVHEVSHIRLEHIFLMENLVLNSPNQKIFKAPIRDDLRPMKGIFHATFVLSRMIRIFRRLSINGGMQKRFRDRLQLCNLQYDIGIASTNHPKAKFSENALKIIGTLDETRNCLVN